MHLILSPTSLNYLIGSCHEVKDENKDFVVESYRATKFHNLYILQKGHSKLTDRDGCSAVSVTGLIPYISFHAAF